MATTLSTIKTSAPRELSVPDCPSQWTQRGGKGPLDCPLFSSQDWTDPATKQYNSFSFLHLPYTISLNPPLSLCFSLPPPSISALISAAAGKWKILLLMENSPLTHNMVARKTMPWKIDNKIFPDIKLHYKMFHYSTNSTTLWWHPNLMYSDGFDDMESSQSKHYFSSLQIGHFDE